MATFMGTLIGVWFWLLVIKSMDKDLKEQAK